MVDEVEVPTVGQLHHEIVMAPHRPTTIIILEDGLDQMELTDTMVNEDKTVKKEETETSKLS